MEEQNKVCREIFDHWLEENEDTDNLLYDEEVSSVCILEPIETTIKDKKLFRIIRVIDEYDYIDYDKMFKELKIGVYIKNNSYYNNISEQEYAIYYEEFLLDETECPPTLSDIRVAVFRHRSGYRRKALDRLNGKFYKAIQKYKIPL